MMQSIPNTIPATPTIRQAMLTDLPTLTGLMQQSVRRLNIQNYSHQQLESALEHLFGIDPQLIEDGTYYVAEIDGEVAGCGGWSRSATLYGVHKGQHLPTQDPGAPSENSAKIRALFVHPNHARRGVGRRLMEFNETVAQQAGAQRLELLASLTGEALYRKCGFRPISTLDLVTPDGFALQAIKMEKQLSDHRSPSILENTLE